MGGEKKIIGDANQVDEERDRKASIFLLRTSRFDSISTRWGYDRSIHGLFICLS